MSNNRLAYTPQHIVSLLESTGYYYFGCVPLDSLVEVGEFHVVEYYLDWEIQIEPSFAVVHTPTGHCWMHWNEFPTNSEMIKRIIRAGNEVSLERSLGGEG